MRLQECAIYSSQRRRTRVNPCGAPVARAAWSCSKTRQGLFNFPHFVLTIMGGDEVIKPINLTSLRRLDGYSSPAEAWAGGGWHLPKAQMQEGPSAKHYNPRWGHTDSDTFRHLPAITQSQRESGCQTQKAASPHLPGDPISTSQKFLHRRWARGSWAAHPSCSETLESWGRFLRS